MIPKTKKNRQLIARAKKESHKNKILEKIAGRYHVENLETLFFIPCIYFLRCKGSIVYIGETTSLMSRISQHINENVKLFDSFSFEKFKGSDMERKYEESLLISKIKPYYNVNHINKVKKT